ncbi:hypothetical protein K432DRAFT_434859 [Lepidopterella palustris CBS 459.81]|uniref:Uncharacterized protein n=1 Tax=Lepidopterella palustris CBS 459.81 TaxID=1314670 RepID=A0A8E2JFQ4_9PEZI|nr:hypothetical protein K432DRAFT_434859 [Lepidopterella palustris CBS 459.81]
MYRGRPDNQGLKMPANTTRLMAKKNPPDERVVYLALKNVFKGTYAEIPKLRFPEVFDVSPAQSAEREASEAEAARNEANAIKDALQGHQDSTREVIQSEEAAESESVETHKNPEQSASKAPFHIPSLFPVYLPFATQHFLLVKVQTILERACFDFGQQTIPDIMQKNRWDCPESAELNLWATEFLKRQGVFHKRKDIGQSLENLFCSVADIRHAAVHRIHMAIEELERNKHVLSSKLEETRKSIAAQREELDRLEKAAVSEMIREDGDYQQFAGRNLLQGITPEEVTVLGAATTEKGTDSDVEDTESADNDKDSSCTECPPGG